ncbi:MAG: VWA domain-containing protein [Verrucomicrobiota bacterium]
MNFLAPAAFAFLAALPIVVVFYLLKRKRVVKLIPSTVLWQRFLAETQASAPFQRLRHNWLLLMQLLILLLVIFALARPFFAGEVKSSRLQVMILDASASMQSTDVKPSRFEVARAQALKWVDSLRDLDQMIVVQAAANTEVKQSATTSKAALRRALEACTVTDSPTRLGEALKLAETLIKNQAEAEVHLFSDGAIPNLGELENRDLPLTFHRVGNACRNLGIVSLDVRMNPENVIQRAVFASILNPTTNAQTAEIELLLDGRRMETRPITVLPTNTLPLIFTADQAHDGIFTLRIVTPDDLAADNEASIVSRLPQPVKILLVSKGNRFLDKALRGAANTEVTVVASLTSKAEGYDLVVLDDVTPAVWPDVNLLAIHTQPATWFTNLSRLTAPPILDWRQNHPLMRYVNFDNVQIAESLAVEFPAWGVAVADSRTTPLIVAGSQNRRRLIWIGFDTLQSTWPLRISFPIFMANAVEWLNPAGISASQLTIKTGEPFRLTLAQTPATARIVRPDGITVPVAMESGTREIVYGDTLKAGIYRLKTDTNEVAFCVNLLDAAESATMPHEELKLGHYKQVAASTGKRASLELWRWVAVAGLLILLFEWWYYHKRTA